MGLKLGRNRKPNAMMLTENGLNQWIFPAWFKAQTDPNSADFCVTGGFENLTSRNWTALRPELGKELYGIDAYGALNYPRGLTLEIWLWQGGVLYTPLDYSQCRQSYLPCYSAVLTEFSAGGLKALSIYRRIPHSYSLRLDVKLTDWDQHRLEPAMILAVIRPFGVNGLAPTYKMVYEQGRLLVDGQVVVKTKRELSHCFLANETSGDLPELIKTGRGSSKISSVIGCCTAGLGYRGLPGELGAISLELGAENPIIKLLEKSHGIRCKLRTVSKPVKQSLPGELSSNTVLDGFYRAGLEHLTTFSPSQPLGKLSFEHILTLNRWGELERSKGYLEYCLKKVGFGGTIGGELLGTAKLIVAVEDYIEYGVDWYFGEKIWSILKRMGFALMTSLARGEAEPEKQVWHCAAFRSLVRLAEKLNYPVESAGFRVQYLTALKDFRRQLEMIQEQPEGMGSAGRLLEILSWLYPLELGKGLELDACQWFERLEQEHLFQGGVADQTLFKGIDLALTAKLGQLQLWQARDYSIVLNLLLEATTATWSWPDKIHPLTKRGIGICGHDPQTLLQMLLLGRLIFVHESGAELHLLPGILNCQWWLGKDFKFDNLFTKFGRVSLQGQWVGNMFQLTIKPRFERLPERMLLKLNPSYKLVYAEREVSLKENWLEITAENCQIRLRLKKTTL